MRVQSFFSETRVPVLQETMRRYPFATLVVQRGGTPDANHLPLLFVERAPHGVLQGHTARALNLAEVSGQEALVIFHAEHAYVSPSWYPSKRATAKAVPTWNYSVVHAYGTLNVIDDAAWLRAHLQQMTLAHESHRAEPWRLEDAPADYIDQMIGALVGIQIEITRLEGKFKLSQNRSAEDREGVITGLRSQDEAGALAVAAQMEVLLRDK